MVIELQHIMWFTALAMTVFYWRGAMAIKDRAYRAALTRCKEVQVQLLDEGVYLRKLWIRRNDRGVASLFRVFNFEFTVSGADRYKGRVEMLGPQILKVELDPHRVM